MVKEYQDGATSAQLALKHGGTDVSARNALVRHGVTLRRGGVRPKWSGSPEQLADAVRRYTARESLSSIAKSIGCDIPPVAEAIRSSGMPIRKTGSKQDLFSDDQAKEIAARHEQGESASALAREYQISNKMLGTLIVRGGGKARGPLHEWPQSKHEEIRDRFLAGERVTDLAKSMGLRVTAISKSLTKSGVVRPKSGPGHWSWRGGRTLTGSGYVSLLVSPEDLPFCIPSSNGRVLEHRLVMAKAIGRCLSDSETVHHIDGDRQNNALENLQLRFGKHGHGVALSCQDCGSNNVLPVPLA